MFYRLGMKRFLKEVRKMLGCLLILVGLFGGLWLFGNGFYLTCVAFKAETFTVMLLIGTIAKTIWSFILACVFTYFTCVIGVFLVTK